MSDSDSDNEELERMHEIREWIDNYPMGCFHDPFNRCLNWNQCDKKTQLAAQQHRSSEKHSIYAEAQRRVEISEKVREIIKSRTPGYSGQNGFLKWKFITICTLPNTDPTRFLKGVEKLVKRKWCSTSKWVYVVEQTKGPAYYTPECDLSNVGCHVHMIVQTDKKKSVILDNVFKDISLFVLTTKEKCDIKEFYNDEFLTQKYEYMLGTKTGLAKNGEPKLLHQHGDIIFRERLKLPKFYANYNAVQFTKYHTSVIV